MVNEALSRLATKWSDRRWRIASDAPEPDWNATPSRSRPAAPSRRHHAVGEREVARAHDAAEVERPGADPGRVADLRRTARRSRRAPSRSSGGPGSGRTRCRRTRRCSRRGGRRRRTGRAGRTAPPAGRGRPRRCPRRRPPAPGTPPGGSARRRATMSRCRPPCEQPMIRTGSSVAGGDRLGEAAVRVAVDVARSSRP